MTDPTPEEIQTKPYVIPEKNLAELELRLATLSGRARMLGLAPITWTQVGEEYRVVNEITGARKRFILVEVHGTAPKIGGWTFVAALTHMLSQEGERIGNLIAGPPDGPEIPETYRTVEPLCQHCGTVRVRTKTFVLRSDEGEWKQVGSGCLRDFLGHADPQAVAEMLQHVWDALRNGEEDDGSTGGGGGSGTYLRLQDVLANTAAIIRVEGWVSRKAARERDFLCATADRVIDNLWPPQGSQPAYDVTPEDEAEAQATIEWAKAMEAKSDYEYNLTVLAQAGYIDFKHWPLAASMVAARRRALGLQVYKDRTERKPSEWQGQVGERITRTLTVTRESTTHGDYGVGHFYVMVDLDGNDYVWHSSRKVLDEGDTAEITAAVKEHGEYNGRKQTKVTRGKIVTGPWRAETENDNGGSSG